MGQNDMVIRNVTEEDIAQIAEIESECFSSPWNEQMLKSQLGDKHIFLAATDDKGLLGYVGLMHVLDEGYISNVAVTSSARRKGVADALIEQMRRCAEALELSFMTLEVRVSNVPAIALYSKHGFKEVGRRKKYYEYPCEDAIIMTLELRD